MPLADLIRDVLLANNDLTGGLMTEQKLGERFGVSRSPVRDALKELEKDGIIERRKRKGIRLKPPSLAEILALYDVRSVLEGLAARLLAERATAADLRELAALAQSFTQARRDRDFDQAEAVDAAFHRRAVELSGNPWLAKIMDNFDIVRKMFRSTSPTKAAIGRRPSPYSHEKMVQALTRADAEECETIFRRHVQWSKQAVVEGASGVKLDQFDSFSGELADARRT